MSFTQALILATQVLIYLRKSRQDDPNQTVEEVLAKHETELQEYAERELGCRIPEENIYREVVSAESIDAREEFKKVLARLEDPEIRAVLVVDPQRLSRGDLGDCDRLIKAFHLSKTRVITPRMDFNLDNKMERKFFQDELLRGRDYYEYVRETLLMGRVRATKRGCYLGVVPPYGYRKVKIGKECTLEVNEREAEVVRMIFSWYAYEGMSPHGICNRLNEMGIPSARGGEWGRVPVRKMLGNKHYIGQVVFNEAKRTAVLDHGQITMKRIPQPDSEVIVAEGKHPAIVSMELWDAAQSRIAKNPKVNTHKKLKNPLSGILVCANCGRTLYYHPYKDSRDRYECRNSPRCYKSVPMDELLAGVVYALEHSSLPELETKLNEGAGDARKIQQKLLEKLEKQMEEYRDQEEQQFDLLETRVYNQATFDRRNAKLREKMEECQAAIYKARAALPQNVDYADRIATLQTAIAAMKNSEITAMEQNRILKTIVSRIEFTGSAPADHVRKGPRLPDGGYQLDITLLL
jgi:hypothetical protein